MLPFFNQLRPHNGKLSRSLEHRFNSRLKIRGITKMSYQLDRVPLADAITGLRQQVREAARRAEAVPKNERFRIEKAEIELTVVAEDSTTAGGEVGWWVFKAKAGVAAKDTATHKVKLTLNLGDVEVSATRKTA
jgi:hypothetical protein